MRHSRLLLASVLALAGLASAALASEAGPVFAQPGLVTSIGQSSDIVIVKALLNTQLKMGFVVKNVAQPGDLAGVRSLVLVVGASAKGLGAAGLDMQKEIERTRALIKAARDQKVSILVLHTGGESRRGKTSNDLIDLVVPEADHVIVVAAGNKDKHFNALAEPKKIPLVEVDKLAAAGEAVKTLYSQ